MWSKTFFLLVFSLGFAASATDLSPQAKLRRLSMHLRGIPPSNAEYAEIARANDEGRLVESLKAKAREYVATPHYVGKMIDRTDQLFRFKTAESLPETRLTGPGAPLPTPETSGGETINAFDFMVTDMAQKNLRWDGLLTGRDYTVYRPIATPSIFAVTADLQFLSVVRPDLGGTVETPHLLPFQVEPGDARFAGAITTGRFFGRYNTTVLNRNRGRAAAIFRIFLCDDMRAVVESGSEGEDELLKKAFPPNPPPDLFHRNVDPVADDKHGAQESCRVCHYKLDPLGKTFTTSGSILSDLPSPGSLVYKREDGSLVDIRGKGIGDLAKAVSQQPEYSRCQVNHFWRWFVRGDRAPSEARMAELVGLYEKSERRLNDFVLAVVDQPEFYTDESSQIPSLLETRPILERCDRCHSGLQEYDIPSFGKFPIGGNAKSHLENVTGIVKRLDLAHDGKDREMPPETSAWQPTKAELVLLKAWIAGRVRDEKGEPTIDESTAEELLEGGASGSSIQMATSFHGTFRRYLTGHDIFRTWRQMFPRVKFTQDNPCQALKYVNRAIVGDPNPFDGEPIHNGPSPSFVKWYGKCLKQWVGAELEAAANEQALTEYFGPEASAALVATGQEITHWSQIERSVRRSILEHLVPKYLGTGILHDEAKFLTKLETFSEKTLMSAKVGDALHRLIFVIASQDEFLTY